MKSVRRAFLPSMLLTLFSNIFAFSSGNGLVNDDIHTAILYLCYTMAGVVFVMLFYSLLKYRIAKCAKKEHFHRNIWVEILWTIIPLCILIALAIPALL